MSFSLNQISYLERRRKELYLFQVSSSDSNSFPLKEDRICVRYLRLAITSRIMRTEPIHKHLTSGARECFQTSHIRP